MAVIKSDNTKGNPNHDSSDGKFTSPDKNSIEISIDDLFLDGDDLDMLDVEVPGLSSSISDFVKKLSTEETFEAILAISDVDKDKIWSISENEAKEYLNAKQLLLEKDKDNSLEILNNKSFFGISPNPLTPSDYNEEKYLSKLFYYNNVFQGNEEQKQEKITNLEKWAEAGKKYQEAKKAFDDKYKPAEDIVLRFDNKYSESKKSNALWIKNGDTLQATKKIFGPISEKQKNEVLSSSEFDSLVEYTWAYTAINYPLIKKISSSSVNSNTAYKNCIQMTNALDKCTVDFDYWCQHGTDDLILNDKIVVNENITNKDLSDLVGKSFKYKSFYSAGGAKDTGFDERDIIINTYCPIGTKGFFVAPYSHYKSENEIILQRGYTMTIRKAYRGKNSNGNTKIFIDIDVIVGSDDDKPTGKELKEMYGV